MYFTDQGEYPSQLGLLAPNYLRTLPTCPAARLACPRLSAGYAYQAGAAPDRYTVVRSGTKHGEAGVTAPNYPQYTCEVGLRER